jgi:hypothetical protein
MNGICMRSCGKRKPFGVLIGTAQHNVQRSAMSSFHDTTRPSEEHRDHGGGSLRVFKQFSGHKAGFGKVVSSRPAH